MDVGGALARMEQPESLEAAESRCIEALREYVSGLASGQDEVSLPDLCAAAEEHFSADFFERLGREQLRRLVYLFTSGSLRPSAGAARRLRGILSREGEEANARGLRLRSVFAEWFEEVEAGRKVSLLAMTAADARKAIEVRRARGSHELRVADWLEKLAARLRGQRTIEQAWKSEEIAAEYQRLVEKA